MIARQWVLLAAGLAMSSLVAAAAPLTPVGLWKNIDDATGKPKAAIRITETEGQFSGKIEKLFRDPGQEQQPVCSKCEGELKGKPVIGLTMLQHLRRNGDTYGDGEILDPENGKLYRCKMTLSEDGKSLEVRGFIGVPWIGRSQRWLREE
jgi:uncharacterized protein (DUF2147 family)